MPLRRGFKAEAERRAISMWSEVGQPAQQPLDLDATASTLGARILMADQLVSRHRLETLEELQPFAFSACTFDVQGQPIIVLNPLHAEGRRRADAAHEIAHLLLRHEMRVPERIAGYVFFTGNADQEDEATWLAGALLLPRATVVRAAHAGMGPADLAGVYGTTEEMARFRLNATGAAIQARRTTKAPRPRQPA